MAKPSPFRGMDPWRSRRIRGQTAALLAVLMTVSASLCHAGPPREVGPFSGEFSDAGLTVVLYRDDGGYAGTIALQGKTYAAKGHVDGEQLVGSFDVGASTFRFTATRAGDVVTLASGGATYTLHLAAPAKVAGSAPARDLVRYEKYSIQDDPQWIGGEAMTMLIPAGWHVSGGMVWRPETFLRVQAALQISDPHSPAQVTIYPAQTFTWGVRVNTPTYLGNEVVPPPRNQFEGMTRFVLPRFRRDLVNAKIVERQDLPQLALAPGSWLTAGPGVVLRGSAGRARFEYDLNGQTVQEDLYLRGLVQIDQRTGVTVWLIDQTASVRGAKGSLDKLSPILRTVAASGRVSLPFYNRLMQFVEMQNQIALEEIRQIGARAAIRARLSDEVSDASKQQYEATQRAQDAANEATAETIRDQQPWTTTDGRKVELPYQYGVAWQGANGEIISTNDVGYNPNSDPNNRTTYTQLEKSPGPSGR